MLARRALLTRAVSPTSARARPTDLRRQPRAARAVATTADVAVPQTEVSHSEPFTVKLHEDSFRSYKCDPPSLEVTVSKEDLLRQYKLMTAMRRMEMAADALYKAKLIRGFCHLAIGQVRVPSFPLRVSTDPVQGSGFSRPGARHP